MKSKNLVIFDSENQYAKALALYFMRKKELMFQVHVCSSIENMEILAREKEVDFLLIDAEKIQNLPESVRGKKIFALSVSDKKTAQTEYPVLYKYQSGEKILADMIKEDTELLYKENIIHSGYAGESKKVIGIFSPAPWGTKTRYALKLGEKLAQSENTLYLNMEVFGGIGGYFEKDRQTLADVLYYARQEKGNLGLLLTTIVCHRDNLDYVLPMPVSEDVKGVCGTEWVSLIKQILEQSIYETVILDMDSGILELHKVLEICTQIHMPVLKGRGFQAKMEQFERELKILGKEEILQKVIQKEVSG